MYTHTHSHRLSQDNDEGNPVTMETHHSISSHKRFLSESSLFVISQQQLRFLPLKPADAQPNRLRPDV